MSFSGPNLNQDTVTIIHHFDGPLFGT